MTEAHGLEHPLLGRKKKKLIAPLNSLRQSLLLY